MLENSKENLIKIREIKKIHNVINNQDFDIICNSQQYQSKYKQPDKLCLYIVFLPWHNVFLQKKLQNQSQSFKLL